MEMILLIISIAALYRVLFTGIMYLVGRREFSDVLLDARIALLVLSTTALFTNVVLALFGFGISFTFKYVIKRELVS